MSKSVFVTRKIPELGIDKLKEKGFTVNVSDKDGVLTKDELKEKLSQKPYDAVLCLLTDKIDAEIFDLVPTVKIFANYAVGYDNIDIDAARDRGVIVTNTPGVLTETVAEHTFALLIAAAKRVAEADRFTRDGLYQGWAPMLFLGSDLKDKTLGIVGLGRIGTQLAKYATTFDMKISYHDVKPNPEFESQSSAEFKENLEELLTEADFVSLHVPLLDSTKHLINKERLSLMKKTSILVNTSRGPVIDEVALVEALKNKVIQAAALDVFEQEPKLAPGLAELENIILTPHIASASIETRSAMSEIAANNIIAVLEGGEVPNQVTK